MEKQTGNVTIITWGDVSRDFIIPAEGSPISDTPGGTALYFAVGAAIWKKEVIGVVSQVGDDYPVSELDWLTQYDINLDGIQILPHPLDNRQFHSFARGNNAELHPTEQYTRRNSVYPRSLLGYKQKSRLPQSSEINHDLSLNRIPTSFQKASLAHIFLPSHFGLLSLPAYDHKNFQGKYSLAISEIPSDQRMKEKIRTLMRNVLCVFIQQKALQNLFDVGELDTPTMISLAEKIKAEYVIIQLGDQGGRLLVETRSQKRWFIPLFPIKPVNPTGKNSAFCGGFMATIRPDYDPLESALRGAVSASLVSQGVGLRYALDASPGLKEARLNHLRGLVRCL